MELTALGSALLATLGTILVAYLSRPSQRKRALEEEVLLLTAQEKAAEIGTDARWVEPARTRPRESVSAFLFLVAPIALAMGVGVGVYFIVEGRFAYVDYKACADVVTDTRRLKLQANAEQYGPLVGKVDEVSTMRRMGLEDEYRELTEVPLSDQILESCGSPPSRSVEE